jgi:undecaprenyl diphosphate synthase
MGDDGESMADLSQLAKPGSPEARLLEQIDLERLPRHVAVIMDGNGRWARERLLPRVAGHRAGIKSVRETLETSARLGLEVLTLYAFSRENWKRPRSEVSTLMELLHEYLGKERQKLIDNDIRLQVIGRIDDLPEKARDELRKTVEITRSNQGLLFNLALSYGGRTEIVDACRSIVSAGIEAERIDAELFASHLYTAGIPDPDLLIRTSGEMRISNFLLWQIAYAEIWVTETRWPDFRRGHLFQALIDYQGRERRYGGLGPRRAGDPATAGRGR